MENKEAIKGLGDLAKKMAAFEKENVLFSMGHGPKEAFPLEVSEIDFRVSFPLGGRPLSDNAKVGDMVSVKPVSGEGKEETFLGMMVGFADYKPTAIYNKATKKITFAMTGGNPAMYVFKLKRVVYGFESFWKKIESDDQLRDITDKDIQNTWYVKALKAMENTNGSDRSTPQGEDLRGEAVSDPVSKTDT